MTAAWFGVSDFADRNPGVADHPDGFYPNLKRLAEATSRVRFSGANYEE
ncbi:hypothetical protein ACRTDU_15290 [Sunxiuqinia elliptica]|nr:hypothetical protein [Sunxiuqinia elliptica]